jgi:hypothetical protein
MESKQDTRYNGWENYETWLVKLWLDNNHPTYDLYHEWLNDAKEQAVIEDRDNHSEFLTIEDDTKRILADTIKEWIEGNNPLNDTANFYTDLLNAALSEVNYFEIAENIMSET